MCENFVLYAYIVGIILNVVYDYFIYYKPYTEKKEIISDIRVAVWSFVILLIWIVSETIKKGFNFRIAYSCILIFGVLWCIYYFVMKYKNIKKEK